MATSSPLPSDPDLPFHLRGNFSPVKDEVTAFDLPVTGAIPSQLRGTYLRNGPNPKTGVSDHWFGGDGMIHGVRLEDGAAKWYRNRYVRGRVFLEDAEVVSEEGAVDRTVAAANTNVIGHAGTLYALVESSFPTVMTPELETVGTTDFDGKLTTAFTAHPKRCAVTGELHFFGYGFFEPYLVYHKLDTSGRLVKTEEIPVPASTMVHDFAITENHVLFMDLPVVFNLETAMARERFPYEWSDSYGARLGVMPRDGSGTDVTWLEIEPCYVFHPMNAFERGGEIVLDVARYPELWRDTPNAFQPASMHRFTLDVASGKVGEQPLDDRAVEFPRTDERRVGLENRYGYAVENAMAPDEGARLVKYDLQTGASQVHDFGPDTAPGEPVFAPASEGAGEDEGWLICTLFDGGRVASELVILDASSFESPAVARIALPQRVPYGFHGNWIPDGF